ncbi:MAG: hypothetical protein HY862_00850 [Chloroflexi bacterium]|nr:hypothetical protein [Chloroflexota bacterium]
MPTKGGLAPAKLVNMTTGEEVECMFNPFEYTLTKQNTWEKKPAKGKNVPEIVFKQGGNQVLKVQLLFDTFAEQGDVRDYTDKIWTMMAVAEQTKNATTGKSRPPKVSFRWGRLNFEAVLTNIQQKYTLFLPDGTPVRTTVDITLEQLIDVDDYSGGGGGGGGGGGAGGGAAATPKVATAQQGQRMDTVAAQQTGDAANHRQVAEANNIDNPHKVPNGTPLVVPHQ